MKTIIELADQISERMGNRPFMRMISYLLVFGTAWVLIVKIGEMFGKYLYYVMH